MAEITLSGEQLREFIRSRARKKAINNRHYIVGLELFPLFEIPFSIDVAVTDLHKKAFESCLKKTGGELLGFHVNKERVSILVDILILRTKAVSVVVNSLKSSSSRALKTLDKDIQNLILKDQSYWAVPYNLLPPMFRNSYEQYIWNYGSDFIFPEPHPPLIDEDKLLE